MTVKTVLALAITLTSTAGSVALGNPAQTTKYTFYSVGGDTAQEIYAAMLRKGPRVNGAKAYAATSATTSQDGKLLQQASCRIDDYQLKLDFVIKLPKIKNEKVLPAADRNRWQQFSAFLKKHEETHRSIWMGCAADLERQVSLIKTRTCAEADKKAQKLWDKMRNSCAKKHVAFDAAEQKKLMQHPFVRLVFKRSLQQQAAKVP
jgi:predicted secreted Zn-dependent protease